MHPVRRPVPTVPYTHGMLLNPQLSPAVPRTRNPASFTRLALAGILLLTAALYSFNALHSDYSDFYASAARSMSLSWQAFIFGAFDPGFTITLDKLSGFLVPQALSARLFGYSAASLALPQVIEGVITVAVIYALVKRWLGSRAGLVAAAIAACTPLLASMFSHPMEDGMLTMFTALAVLFWQRSLDSGKVLFLLMAGAMVGLGFQAKMMQSWLVLPALAAVYFVISAHSVRRKIGALAAAGAVTLSVSVAWMLAFSLVPAALRPWVDGTTSNSIFAMVFGYNGINHFLHNAMPGALVAAPSWAYGTAPWHAAMPYRLIGHTPFKFFAPEYATQIGWLYPLAAAGLVLGFVQLRRDRSAGIRQRGLASGLLFCTLFLATLAIVLGVMSLPHTAYLASFALPLAGLASIGVLLLWRASKLTLSRWRFAMPITFVAQTAWTLGLLANSAGFALWLLVPLAVLSFIVLAALLHHTIRQPLRPHMFYRAAVSALVLSLLAPTIWTLSTANPAFNGTGNDATAGARLTSVFNPPNAHLALYGRGLNSNRVVPATAAFEKAAYLFASSKSRAPVVVDSWRVAAPLIMGGATRVLPVGGFTSRIPEPTPTRFRFVLLTSPGSKSSQFTPHIMALQRWVEQRCTYISPTHFGALTAGPIALNDKLYDCGPQ